MINEKSYQWLQAQKHTQSMCEIIQLLLSRNLNATLVETNLKKLQSHNLSLPELMMLILLINKQWKIPTENLLSLTSLRGHPMYDPSFVSNVLNLAIPSYQDVSPNSSAELMVDVRNEYDKLVTFLNLIRECENNNPQDNPQKGLLIGGISYFLETYNIEYASFLATLLQLKFQDNTTRSQFELALSLQKNSDSSYGALNPLLKTKKTNAELLSWKINTTFSVLMWTIVFQEK